MNDLDYIASLIQKVLASNNIRSTIDVYYNANFDYEACVKFENLSEKNIEKTELLLKNHFQANLDDYYSENTSLVYVFIINKKYKPLQPVSKMTKTNLIK